MPLAAAPKFAHHDIRGRAALHGLERPGVRLHRIQQTVLFAQLGKMAEVIFRKQIGDGAAQIPEKALGSRRTVHHAAGECGQEFHRVIAATFLKFGAEIFGPVLAADFVAVDQRGIEGFPAGERGDVIEDFLHEAIPMRVERDLAELVALKTLAFLGRRMIIPAGRGVAEAEDNPFAGGNPPIQLSVSAQPGSEINDAAAFNRSGGCVVGFTRGQHFGAVKAGLGIDVFNDQTRREFDLCQRNVRVRGQRPGGHLGELHAPESRGHRLRTE